MLKQLRTEPVFVTVSDFYNYTGKDLNQEFEHTNNHANSANIFLKRVEDMLMARIDSISFRLDRWDRLSEFQQESMRKAVIFQAEYIIRNSEMFTDSGYDPDKGFNADFEKIQNAALCPTSVELLINCGILNHVVRNRRRYTNLGLGEGL